MSPSEYQEEVNKRFNGEVDSLYRKLLRNSNDALETLTYYGNPCSASLTIIPESDREYSKKQLTLACKMLLNHYRELGWVASISTDFQCTYKTSKHTLHLINTESVLIRFWYKLFSVY